MEDQLISKIEECLAAIAAGVSMESCLLRYPDDADELAPLLQIALKLQELPQPRPAAPTAQRAKSKFLAEAEKRRVVVRKGGIRRRFAEALATLRSRRIAPTWTAPVRILATTTIALVLVLLISGGVIHAASGSLPGDPLYGFKLLGEDLQRAFTFNQDDRIRLEEAFTTRRLNEVRELLLQRRREEVVFGGLLREYSSTDLHIEDIPVIMDQDTLVRVEPTLDTYVKIHGITQPSGAVLAQAVEIEGAEIIGLVEAMRNNVWRIAGQEILMDARVFVLGQVRLGDCVEVHARRFPDGTLLAREIEPTAGCAQDDATIDRVDEEDQTPTPTITATPSPTWTPTPTATPTLQKTATALPTSEPEEVDEVAPTLRPATAPTATPSSPAPAPTEDPDDADNDDENDNDDANSNDNNDDANDNDNDDDNTNVNDDNSDDNSNDNSDDNSNDNDDDNSNDSDDDNSNDSDDNANNDNEDNTNDNDNSGQEKEDKG